MYYPIIVHPDQGFQDQAIEAFGMYRLIRYGLTKHQVWKDIPDRDKAVEREAIRRFEAARKENRIRKSLHPDHAPSIEAERHGVIHDWMIHGRTVRLHHRATDLQMEVVCEAFENQC